MTELSVTNLITLDDAEVISRVREVFRQQLRTSDALRPLFVPGLPRPPVPPVDPSWTDRVALALVCSSIAWTSVDGIGAVVDVQRCGEVLRAELDPAASVAAADCGQALYDWAFPGYCSAAGTPFGRYQESGATGWGDALADAVAAPAFIHALAARIEAADPGWRRQLDLVLHALTLLAPQRRSEALGTWRRAFPDAQIDPVPPGRCCLAPSMFRPDEFLPDVVATMGAWRRSDAVAPSASVAAFLNTNGRELTTGELVPRRLEVPRVPGCFVAGTPVLVADGDRVVEVPIEDVGAGEAVVCEHGTLALCTGEVVQVPLRADEPVYGINDTDPFFSASHLFRTPDGWRAVDPRVARTENPDREVAALTEGDVVLMCRPVRYWEAAGPRIDYRRVRVDRITQRRHLAGSSLYGLHLDGGATYHAHGYCVGANYPMITEWRLAEGFGRLTAPERELVRGAFSSVMPLLASALGEFLEEPLYRALAGATPRRLSTVRQPAAADWQGTRHRDLVCQG